MSNTSTKWKPEKAAKKLAVASRVLLPGETVWFLGPCATMRANMLMITDLRILALIDARVNFELHHVEATQFTPDGHDKMVVGGADGRKMKFAGIPTADFPAIINAMQYAKSVPPPAHLVSQVQAQRAETEAQRLRQEAASRGDWPNTIVKGPLSRKASEAVLRVCHGAEQPWLIIASAGWAGVLVGFEDRVAIVKAGGMTAWMAGAMGGERSTTFHYRDITGIEYNSGLTTGVLEILTASYQGTANKDFWRGTDRSRNANANDPFTLSNTLPLAKREYQENSREISLLRERIAASKTQNVRVEVASPPTPHTGLGDQLAKLAELHAAGVLTDAEFAASKARLLGSP